MGFYESSEEILACPHNRDVALIGYVNRFGAGLSGRTVYLHVVLSRQQHTRMRVDDLLTGSGGTVEEQGLALK
jgi:hypothetical protein